MVEIYSSFLHCHVHEKFFKYTLITDVVSSYYSILIIIILFTDSTNSDRTHYSIHHARTSEMFMWFQKIEDLVNCKKEITALNKKFEVFRTTFESLLQQMQVATRNEIMNKVIKESAKTELRLENKLTYQIS